MRWRTDPETPHHPLRGSFPSRGSQKRTDKGENTMAAKLQCEICGGKLVGKPGGVFECEYCGMEFDTAWAKSKLQEITGTVKVEGTVEVTGKVKLDGPVQVDISANKEAQLQRGMIALEDREWEKAKDYFNQALNYDAKYAEAYLGLAMADEKCQNRDSFRVKYITTGARCRYNKHFARVRQYCSEDLFKWISQLDEEGKRADEEYQRAEEKQILEKQIIAEEKRKKAEQNIERLKPIRDKLLLPATMISAGVNHTVGLRSDGTVVATTFFGYDQCRESSWKDVVAVAAGREHTVGLLSNGTVVAAGSNTNRECNVSDWRAIGAVAAASRHTIGLHLDGTVVDVGDKSRTLCKLWTDIVAIAAGENHTVGLRANGTVVALGENKYGECDFFGWREIVSIAAGDYHTVGLRSDGTVVAVGLDLFGACNVAEWTDIVGISAGSSHTVGLRADGTVIATKYYCANKYNRYRGQCDVSEWKLFNNYETIKAERLKHRVADEKREATVETKRKALNREKAQLQAELANLKGLFSGGKRRDLEARIVGIDSALKNLK